MRARRLPGLRREPLLEERHDPEGVSIRLVTADEAAADFARLLAKACPWCDSPSPPYLAELQEDDEPGLALICPVCEEQRGWVSSSFVDPLPLPHPKGGDART